MSEEKTVDDIALEKISVAMLLRLVAQRPDMRADIVAELRRRGVQVIE